MNTHVKQINVEQANALVQFWNQTLAPKFVKYRHIIEGGLSRHSEAVMPLLDVRAGDHALDVGCGFGDTAIELVGRVGTNGKVLGVDCCDAFLDIARSRSEKMFLPNLRFENRDAERDLVEAEYDFVFARFGTMFFTNPVAGLRTMRRALKPGGRMAHIVWRQREDNPWLSDARDVVRRFLPPPGPDAQTCGPGPFSMADEKVTRMQMEAAGFADIEFRRIDAKVNVGRDVEDAVNFQLAVGPAGETYREAGALGETRRAEIEAALSKLFEGVIEREGGLWMDSSSWLITGRNPRSAS
ncbi:Demethylmenaquinone methyltransferase [Roseovarius litorisediminis]|uniref:Demethylmenaquinone methyltransferase n=1 Tax=Roseovarius litorisediminis TaxID=1312363 RepID=A0A1Y5S464_9RHOB|nr:class I SAM-dependent methyltransferase [Roseovarius litorisediminis]SLN31799.1 Demethylmenaquinone methyltransferase [Roseovarius litorisediminis]